MTNVAMGARFPERRSAQARISDGSGNGKDVARMATVQEQIFDAFFAKLAQSNSIDQSTIDALRKALDTAKKLKADDFVSILVKEPVGGKP